MKITELIAELKHILRVHGDIEMELPDGARMHTVRVVDENGRAVRDPLKQRGASA